MAKAEAYVFVVDETANTLGKLAVFWGGEGVASERCENLGDLVVRYWTEVGVTGVGGVGLVDLSQRCMDMWITHGHVDMNMNISPPSSQAIITMAIAYAV